MIPTHILLMFYIIILSVGGGMYLQMDVGKGQRATLRSWVLSFHCGL